MKIPLSWLREYVDFELSPEELAARLTMAGTEVASVDSTGSWDNVVVGLVKQVRAHPNADRLRLVTVDHGDGEAEVVCGAPNVAVDQKIAFASVGAELINPHTDKRARLKQSKIRGVVSAGMVCSEKELGLSDEHEGILVLDPDASVGTPLSDLLGDTVLDLDLTPNRPDCLSILGIAREVAALTGGKVREPQVTYEASDPPIESFARVVIEDPDLCPRYTASVIRGVKIGPSPRWLAERLEKVGERPINNIVDITNYVMFEMGQPLHSFDYDKVADQTVVVRRAKQGERLVTLDDEERNLDSEMLVIADPQRSIGLGGVMGGANTEIFESTTSVFLEAANFLNTNNRRTAHALELGSQATLRFEKGLRPELAEIALRRATRLILEIAGGTVAEGIIDEWPGRDSVVRTVHLQTSKVLRVLGMDLDAAQVAATLSSLGFGVTAEDGGWEVAVPYWRPDVSIPEDLCEELARVIGYDSMPVEGLSGQVPRWEPQPERDLRERVKDALVEAGMQETISYPGTTVERHEKTRPDPSLPPPLRLANPMSRDQEYLRTTLRGSVLETLGQNARVWRGGLALFEVGSAFWWRGEGLPEERDMVVGAFAGPRSALHWAGDDGLLDFFDAKGALETLLAELGVDASFAQDGDATFSPGRAAKITVPTAGDLQIGVVGEVVPDILDAMDIELRPVALFEVDLGALASAVAASSAAGDTYEPFGRFPESPRDLALVVDDTVSAGDVTRVATRNRLVVEATVFDVYRGEELPEGKKSLAVRLVYRSPKRTLTAEDVSKVEQSILRALASEVGAELRV